MMILIAFCCCCVEKRKARVGQQQHKSRLPPLRNTHCAPPCHPTAKNQIIFGLQQREEKLTEKKLIMCIKFSHPTNTTKTEHTTHNVTKTMSNNLILHGNMLSQPTRVILWFCHLNHIPIQFKNVQLHKAEHKSPQFLKWNPNGKIPVLEHAQESSFYLFESQAIVHYLRRLFIVDQHSHWYPEPSSVIDATLSNIQQIAKIDSYLSWHQNHFRPGVAGYAFAKYIGPSSFGRKFTEEQVKNAHVLCLQQLQQLNDYWLTNSSTNNDQRSMFISGAAEPSIADLFCYSELAQLMIVDEWNAKSGQFSTAPLVAPYQNVVKWMKEIEQVNGYSKIHDALLKIATKRFGGGQSKL